MTTISTLLALCVGNPPGDRLIPFKKGGMMTSSNGNIFRVTGPLCGEFTGPGEFPTQRPVTRSFDVFFDLRLNKPLSKQSWGWWFETLSRSLWRHRHDLWRFFDVIPSKLLEQHWGGRWCEALWGPYDVDNKSSVKNLTHWGRDKMDANSQTTFQMHFREWKSMNFA